MFVSIYALGKIRDNQYKIKIFFYILSLLLLYNGKEERFLMQDVYQIMMTGGLLISIVSLIAWWSIFKKAGYKGWYAIIPLFNVYIFCKLTLGSGWLVLTMLIPIFNIFIYIRVDIFLSYFYTYSCFWKFKIPWLSCLLFLM